PLEPLQPGWPVGPRALYFWHFRKPIEAKLEVLGADAADTNHVFGYCGPPPQYAESRLRQLEFQPGVYRLLRFAVLQPRAPREGDAGEWFDVLAHAEATPQSGIVIHSLEEAPDFIREENQRPNAKGRLGEPSPVLSR